MLEVAGGRFLGFRELETVCSNEFDFMALKPGQGVRLTSRGSR